MNNKKLLTPLFLAATFLLASCSTSTIVSRPDWQNDPIIVDDIGLKDNKMKSIYDAIKALGDTNATVLKTVLFDIAKKNIGTFDELKEYSTKDISDSKFQEFVKTHKAYQPKDNNCWYMKEGVKTQDTLSNEDSLKISQELIKNQFTQLRLDILEKLFTDLKGADFVKDNLFSEDKFIMNLRKNMYDIPHPDVIDPEGTKLHKDSRILIKPVTEDPDKLEEFITKHYLNLKAIFTPEGAKDPQYIYTDYINRKILPDLYQTYLIQNYVNEQRYSNLGRSYARKVNMITVPASGDQREKVRSMLNSFAKNTITETGKDYNFDVVETALRGNVGIISTESSYDLLAKAGFTPITVKNAAGTAEYNLEWPLSTRTSTPETEASPIAKTHVFKGTKLGDLVEKYLKIFDVTVESAATQTATVKQKKITSEVTTAYNDLTNSGAYSIDHGLTLKERELLLTTYTKNGWYLKSGGLSDLNATIKDRLFNISVANKLDSGDTSFKSTDYVKFYGNKAFVTTTSFSSSEEAYRMVLDSDTANLSIIQVEEAVSTSKLSLDKDNKSSYRYLKASADKTAGVIAQNKITHEVIKATASTGDTYKKNATQYYLLISNIVFSDQSVYDYFKSQYPDLFK